MDDLFDSYESDFYDDANDIIEEHGSFKVLAQTEKGIQIARADGSHSWFPKSVVADITDTYLGYDDWFEPTWVTPIKAMQEIDGDF